MIATDVASPFLTPFKLTMIVSLFLAIPFILQQIWGFIAPGLYRHEKRIAIPLLVSSICCSTPAWPSPTSWCSR
jgi:sec-independent protein translocase protein TatC